jgi:hypothetical protein
VKVPVTVWGPGVAAMHVAPEHDPSGEIVKVVWLVRSATGVPVVSTPVAT